MFDHWGLRPQTPLPPEAGGSARSPPKQLSHCEFLAPRLFCVDADDYVGESLINTIFDAGKTKRAFYVINLNRIG